MKKRPSAPEETGHSPQVAVPANPKKSKGSKDQLPGEIHEPCDKSKKVWPDLSFEKATAFPQDLDTSDEPTRLAFESAIYGEPIVGHPEVVRAGNKYRPMRDGSGPSSVGRYRPDHRWYTPLHEIGAAWKAKAKTLGIGDTLRQAAAATFAADPAVKMEKSPFTEAQLAEAQEFFRVATGHTEMHVAVGQPFRLQLLSKMAWLAHDLDWQLPLTLEEEDGANLGVEEELDAPHGVLAPNFVDASSSEDEALTREDNYGSAAAGTEQLLKMYEEEQAEGMSAIFNTEEEAAAHAGCTPEELVYGAL